MKIGVLIDSNSVRNFEYVLLKYLADSPLYECEVIISSSSHRQTTNSLLDSYLKFDKFVNARGKNHMQLRTIDDLNIVTKIEIAECDLLLNLSSETLTQKSITLAQYGVWELRFGQTQTDAHLAGIMEVFQTEDTTPIRLCKLPDSSGNGYIIDQMLCATHELSPVKNRSDVVWKSHMLVVRNLEKLVKAPQHFMQEKYQNLYFFKDKKTDSQINVETTLLVLKQGLKNITSRFDRLFRKQQWSIYYAPNTKETTFNQNMSAFEILEPPKEEFWADPFVVDKDDKSYIFFEAYIYKTHKGHLSVVEYDHKTGQMSEAKEILKTPYHLSYPFMMEHEGEIYMIPEGCKDNDVKLYKATNFPYEWEVERILLDDIVAVDTTLFFKDDTWWLFANVAEKEGFSLNEELYIYHCKDFLTDTWTPHQQNPVLSSVQTSRPAGGIILHHGDYYRPSQNSVGCYGRSTNFNKITTLTPECYEEVFVSEITPEYIDGIYAVHTYNASQNMTVIDGLKKIGRFF
ncbi:MAG: hypothetical protein K0U47_02690 [Epsilonproteobacteria bacterium]|nr:hypothetical protein [Campylobacterota bacterium]